jgi:hypothetical protein
MNNNEILSNPFKGGEQEQNVLMKFCDKSELKSIQFSERIELN